MTDLEDQDFVVLGNKDVEDFNANGLLPQPAEEVAKILRWLQPTDFASESSDCNKHLASYVNGTGKWIQRSEQYQRWLKSSDYGTLWIKAVPGAGKSVVAAQLVSQLTEEKVPVLHFFFRQIITTNKTPQSLVRDWMSQVLGYSPLLQLELKDLLKNNRSLESVAFDELWDHLVTALGSLRRVYCVADALDEMDTGNETFLRQLIQLGRRNPSSLKVMMTSRALPRIETVLKEVSVLQMPLQLSLVDQDIAIYVQSRLSAIDLPKETKIAIQQTIRTKSEGLFLYARLMVDDLVDSDKLYTDHIHDALSYLPSGLADMYTTILFDHSKRSGVSRDLQFLILQFVTHSPRPLRLLEIASMVDFMRKTTNTELDLTATGVPQDTKSIIRAGCGPLLEISDDETVSILHHSLTEFLVDPDRIADDADHFPRIDFAITHRTMALICIDYLRSDWFNDWEISNDRQRGYDKQNSSAGVVRMKYPFLDYAINNWHRHLSEYDRNDEEVDLKLDHLMEPKSKLFLSCLDLMDVDSRPGKVSPLHVAATKGLPHHTTHLLEHGQDINVLDFKSRTPLHRAAEYGHAKVVQILLNAGAANDPDDYAGLKPLHLAASSNHSAIVKLLLESGVDSLTPKTKEHPGNWCGNAARSAGEMPVEYACTYGHTESVREFIPFLDNDGLSKALCWASGSGKTDAVLAILDSPIVDVNKMIDGKTPLHLASHARDTTSMRRLLDLKADPTIKCNMIFGKHGIRTMGAEDELKASPLHAYAASCRQGLSKGSISETLKGFRMLLEAGCDINEFDAYGQTTFHQSVSGGSQFDKSRCSVEILVFLLENGATISGTKNGLQPLHLIQGDAEEIIDLLVAKGADVNAREPGNNRTPLFKAVESYHDLNFQVLLRHGADVNAQDKNGDTPLHTAITQATISNSKIEALLSHGADSNARNMKGETPLHLLRSYSPSGDILSILLKANADLEIRDDAGLTVLLKAVTNNTHRGDVTGLIKAGAKVDACDLSGRTVLHLACEKALSSNLIKQLVEAGARATAQDFSGNTIFHQVARQAPEYHQKEQLELLETILDLGVSPRSRNHAGQTPFHIAAGMRRDTLMSMYKTDPYEFLLGPKCNLDVNEPDHRGIRPIHLAATLSETQFARLIDEGADPLNTTTEGQSTLQIACRARQSNIVGLILDLYKELKNISLVDHVDKQGRTALHYAVKSGRLESVKLLLEAGADANFSDSKGCKPLDMCLHFKAENFYWTRPSSGQYSGKKDYIEAAYVTLDDSRRPGDGIYYNSTPGSTMTSEFQTVGVRQIIRALVAHGANISFLTSSDLRKSYGGRSHLLEFAMSSDDEVLVDELLSIAETKPVEATTEGESECRYYTPWDDFKERYARLRPQTSAGLLSGIIKEGENNIGIFQQLLKTENERGIEEMQRLGVDLIKPDWNGESCLTTLAKWGYASLLEKVGAQASMIDKPWFIEIEKTDRNLPGRLRPILHIACERSLPNFDVLKVLVEKLGINVNCKTDGSKTALHILAQSRNWWQDHALKYLIERGAEIDSKDDGGCTALHIAISNSKKRAAEILLKHGADPNILDSNNMSCLNKVGSDPAIAHLLIRQGADVSAGKKPFIFNAIESLDLNTVNLVIEMKANLNIRPTPDKLEGAGDDSEMDIFSVRRHMLALMGDVSDRSYPIHFAAQKKFNTVESRPKIIPIIESLLRGGANPVLPYNEEGDSVLHEICESEGIVKPFLEIPNIDLELRDSKGRTPLLAACTTPGGWFNDGKWTYLQPTTAELLFQKGVDITATDNEGRNVLHHLLQTNDGRQNNRKSTKPTFELFLSQTHGPALASQKDASGSTPLHYALKNRALWAVNTLLEKGADPLLPDPEGNIALHHICAQFSPANYQATNPLVPTLFDKFLSLGIDINTPNDLGQSPIFSYFSHNPTYLENLPKLLNAGADLKVKDIKGQGLLHVIAKQDYKQSQALARFNEAVRIQTWRSLRG